MGLITGDISRRGRRVVIGRSPWSHGEGARPSRPSPAMPARGDCATTTPPESLPSWQCLAARMPSVVSFELGLARREVGDKRDGHVTARPRRRSAAAPRRRPRRSCRARSAGCAPRFLGLVVGHRRHADVLRWAGPAAGAGVAGRARYVAAARRPAPARCGRSRWRPRSAFAARVGSTRMFTNCLDVQRRRSGRRVDRRDQCAASSPSALMSSRGRARRRRRSRSARRRRPARTITASGDQRAVRDAGVVGGAEGERGLADEVEGIVRR